MSSRNAPDIVERAALRVGHVPVDVLLARNEGALVPAAHRHDDIGALCQLLREELRHAPGEVDADLIHRLDHFGMDTVGGRRPRRLGLVSARGRPVEERRAHLRASSVVQADEQHPRHHGFGSGSSL